jgi:hypothetical protein
MADILSAAQSEISRLERDLASDPRYRKLNLLRDLVRIYQNERVNGSEIASILTPQDVRKRGRQLRPERERLYGEIDRFLAGQSAPVLTADIFSHLESIGVKIPGENPRNNLSAILSNTKDRYQSHGRQGWTLQSSATIPNDEPLAPSSDRPKNGDSKWDSF